MSDDESNPLIANPHDVAELDPVPAARKRPKPGERRTQILQALAAMLEKPGADRITTASLAAVGLPAAVCRNSVNGGRYRSSER